MKKEKKQVPAGACFFEEDMPDRRPGRVPLRGTPTPWGRATGTPVPASRRAHFHSPKYRSNSHFLGLFSIYSMIRTPSPGVLTKWS